MKTSRNSTLKIVASLIFGALLIFVGSASAQLIITGSSQTSASAPPFTPTWTPDTSGLLTNLPPTTATGNFSEFGTGGNATNLTTVGEPIQIRAYSGAGNLEMCGSDSTAGSLLVYTLTNGAPAFGYILTNITVYGGWQDWGRDAQDYIISYSTVSNPTTFTMLTQVHYNPPISSSLVSATRVVISDASGGPVAVNVYALQFSFITTSPHAENGAVGYTAITAQGTTATGLTSVSHPITYTHQDLAAGATPSFAIETDSLVANQLPTTAVNGGGSFTLQAGMSLANLTDGTFGADNANSTYASCGIGQAGSYLIYSLTNSVNGSDITNIVVYSGWGDYGRDGQFYNVSYSTVSAPTTFIPLADVYYNPLTVPNASANRVAIGSTGAPLAQNVAAIKFDFSPQTQPPGDDSGNYIDFNWSGYAEIVLEGTNSAPPVAPPSPYLTQDTTPSYAQTVVGDQVVFTAAYSNSPPANLQWLVITNGVTNIISGATGATLTLNNVQLANSGSYLLKAVNATNGAAAPSYSTAATLLVGSAPAAVNNVIMNYAEQSASASGFYPPWTVNTGSDLIYGYPIIGDGSLGSATAGTGSYSLGGASGDPNILDDGVLGDSLSTLVSCGRVDFGAGVSVTYYLNTNSPSAPYGFNLTNITVFGGWPDDSANEQKYQVLYSTVSAPGSFITFGTFDYKPADSSGYPSATRTTLVPATTALAQNVYAVQIYFSVESLHNWNGYSEITIGGKPAMGIIPALTQDITPLTAEDVVGSSLTLTGNFSGATGYQWQKNGTNLIGQTSTTLTLNNLHLTDTAANGGYALLGYNAAGTNSTRACAVIIDPVPAVVSNIVTAFAYQSSDASAANPFAATWDTNELGSSLIAGQNPPAGGSAGDFTAGVNCGALPVLTDGNYGVFSYDGTYPAFAAGGPNAGQYVIYTLGANAYGYNVTNIQIAGGWNDNGRNSQWYTVSYNTVANPLLFIPIDVVTNSPVFPNQSVIRTTMTPAAGALATNAYELKVDFTTPPGVPNQWSGYSEISVFGAPSVTPPPGLVITASNEQAMTPDWVVETPSLIAGQLPGSSTGNFTEAGGSLTNLTDGLIDVTGVNAASCGGDGTAGSALTYTCTNGSWNITNIVVYTGWTDNGRDGQFYNISYSTLSAPATFLPLVSVNYNPSVPAGITSANRVDIAPPLGQTMLVSNVAAVSFDFTPQGSQDFGWSGYTEIVIQGTNTPSAVVPTLPATFAQPKVSDGNLILTGTGGTPAGYSYTWLATTNLSAPIIWTTNFTGTLDGAGNFSNSIPIGTSRASFFRFRMP